MVEGASSDDERRLWFRRCVLPHEARLHGRAGQLARVSGLDAEDLVQDVLLRMMCLDSWRTVHNPLAFMHRIMGNLAMDAIRHAKVVSVEVVADIAALNLADDAPDQAAILSSRDELRRLMTVVETLPAQCRKAFTLRKLHGLSVREVADRLGISVSTAEKHLVKGLRHCTEQLASGGERHHEQQGDARADTMGGGGLGRAPRRRY